MTYRIGLAHGAITMRRNQIWVAMLAALVVGLGPVVAQQPAPRHVHELSWRAIGYCRGG
jgi:hypothetical protein